MKYLGIDYGDSKVGLAIADSETKLALPYKIISGKDWQKLFTDLSDIIRAEGVESIVVGVPINAQNESASIQEKRVRQFIESLEERFIDTEIIPYDERFSTQAAQRLGAGGKDDDVAAMLILQNYIDGLN
ncbi:MAG: putative Holliday junction resolvase [Parcubacteria group bacterium ADurb.Bin326]|nr:MAG: putative Holliday junction resolvase [Parcubacteria group bacterium ADurb.Bin326]